MKIKKSYLCAESAIPKNEDTGEFWVRLKDITDPNHMCFYDFDTEETCVIMDEGISKEGCKHYQECNVSRRLNNRRADDFDNDRW